MKPKSTSIITKIFYTVNLICAAAMLFCGYVCTFDPTRWPMLSLLGLVFPFFLILNFGFMLVWTFWRWRNVLISFSALVLCYGPTTTYIGLNRGKDLPERKIKVMSYNVLGFQGTGECPLRRDSNALVHYLVEQDCDIVCLQEANVKSLSESMSQLLRSAYPYVHSGEKGTGSQTLLSRFPIIDASPIPYDSEGNLSIAYRVEAPFGEVLVINNHFESNSFSAEEKEHFRTMMRGKMDKHQVRAETRNVIQKLTEAVRRRTPQVKAVADYVRQHEGETIILCGDFNEWPNSYTHQVLAQLLTDCFVSSGQGVGWSYTRDAMRVRIDNIMCSENLKPYGCYVDNKVRYSDHFPIITWMEMPD